MCCLRWDYAEVLRYISSIAVANYSPLQTFSNNTKFAKRVQIYNFFFEFARLLSKKCIFLQLFEFADFIGRLLVRWDDISK
jgi:hypothetical protein